MERIFLLKKIFIFIFFHFPSSLVLLDNGLASAPFVKEDIQKGFTSKEVHLQNQINKLTESLTLEQKVGQLLIFGFSSTSLDQNLKSTLSDLQPGGLIVFQRNIKSPLQIADLNANAHDYSSARTGLPLLIMVDQEGGLVSRIKTNPQPPSALSLGTAENPTLSRQAGFYTGQVLSLLGFNMNLAPVVDISNPDKLNFIGNRSFGSHPELVTQMGQNFADGLEEAGVLPTFKHFPGHGGTVSDSHFSLPVKLTNIEELTQSDLVPFAKVANSKNPAAIMVGHISLPNIDPSGLPATFSRSILTELLREKMGFSGLVVTDDIEMHGASNYKSVGERAVKAVEAGADMVMIAWTRKNQTLAYNALLKAVKEKRISQYELNERTRRIIFAKLQHKSNRLYKTNNKEFSKVLTKSLNDLKSLSDKVVSQIFSNHNLLNLSGIDLSTSKTKIFVLSGDYHFYKIFKETSQLKSLYIPLSAKKPFNANTVFSKNLNEIGVFYVTGSGTAKILNKIPNEFKKQILVVNTMNPGVLTHRHLYPAIFDINTRNHNSAHWLANKINSLLQIRVPAETKESRVKRKISSF